MKLWGMALRGSCNEHGRGWSGPSFVVDMGNADVNCVDPIGVVIYDVAIRLVGGYGQRHDAGLDESRKAESQQDQMHFVEAGALRLIGCARINWIFHLLDFKFLVSLLPQRVAVELILGEPEH